MLNWFIAALLWFGQSIETQFEVWLTPKSGGPAKKFSVAPTREVADKVAAGLKTAGTAEVKPVAAVKGGGGTGGGNTGANPTTPASNLSGGKWWDDNQAKYKSSKEIKDLDKDWGPKLQEFIDALTAAGATADITVGYRSQQRQYLMYYCAQIARGNMTAAEVDKLDKLGVDIKWDHGDDAKSKKAAQEMLDRFGIGTNPVGKPTSSNHTKGLAVDMNISWTGDLKIKKKDGTEVTIKGAPRTGLNKDLWDVGDSYGVKKYEKYSTGDDPPHWSSDGH